MNACCSRSQLYVNNSLDVRLKSRCPLTRFRVSRPCARGSSPCVSAIRDGWTSGRVLVTLQSEEDYTPLTGPPESTATWFHTSPDENGLLEMRTVPRAAAGALQRDPGGTQAGVLQRNPQMDTEARGSHSGTSLGIRMALLAPLEPPQERKQRLTQERGREGGPTSPQQMEQLGAQGDWPDVRLTITLISQAHKLLRFQKAASFRILKHLSSLCTMSRCSPLISCYSHIYTHQSQERLR